MINRGKRRALPPLRGLAPLVALLVLWQLLGDPNSPYFPSPSAWWSALVSMASEGVLAPAVWDTLQTFLFGLIAALVIGTTVGAVVGAFRGIGNAVGPLFELLRTTPPPVIVPILALLIGTNKPMMVAVTAFAAVWPILLNTSAAMRAVPSVRLEGARSLRLSYTERAFKVVLPSLTPGVVLGLSVAVPVALIAALLVELLTSSGGLGLLMLTGQRQFDAPTVYALLAVTGLIGLALNAGVAVFESRVMRNWTR